MIAAFAVVLVVAGVVVLEVTATRGATNGTADPAPTPEGPSLPAVTTEGEPDAPAATREAPSSRRADPPIEPTATGVRWDATLAIALPVSSSHGPAILTPTTAAAFDRTRQGAALAAAHLLARTSPRVGPDVFTPTLDTQVRGPNRTALATSVQAAYDTEAAGLGVVDGAPLPGADAQLIGYRFVRYAEADAAVEVLLSSTALRVDGQLVAIRVSLQWSDADWQLIAPPRGDWAVVTTVVPADADDVIDYDGIA